MKAALVTKQLYVTALQDCLPVDIRTNMCANRSMSRIDHETDVKHVAALSLIGPH